MLISKNICNHNQRHYVQHDQSYATSLTINSTLDKQPLNADTKTHTKLSHIALNSE